MRNKLNHEEYFKSLQLNGCPECQDLDNILIQRRIEEQINYDEYWNIGDSFQLNSKEDRSRIKKVIWYVVFCNNCEYEERIDDIDIVIEHQEDWNNTNIQEDVFFKEIEVEV